MINHLIHNLYSQIKIQIKLINHNLIFKNKNLLPLLHLLHFTVSILFKFLNFLKLIQKLINQIIKLT